jgi:hypothetical protein
MLKKPSVWSNAIVYAPGECGAYRLSLGKAGTGHSVALGAPVAMPFPKAACSDRQTFLCRKRFLNGILPSSELRFTGCREVFP